MHKYFKAIIFIAVAAILCCSFTASAADIKSQGIRFAAYCETNNDIVTALKAGASFISVSDKLDVTQVAKDLPDTTALIVDADSIEEADKIFASLGADSNVYYRINAGASKATEWAASKGVKLIGYYKGNIFPIAVSAISKYTKAADGAIIQMQTNNQDGVILHDTVTSGFAKHGAYGMFSFVDSTRSAKRTDSLRSWDDLVARGYTIIETAYPADFADYLEANTAERQKLADSVKEALAVRTDGCAPNRVKDYNSALESASSLLADESSATYEMADARMVLNEAVKNITIQDGSQLKGDFKITPARVAWALFGIALVLSWQIFFRKRWAKS